MRCAWLAAGAAASVVALGGCGSGGDKLEADTSCRDFLQADREDQDKAVARVADDLGVTGVVSPMARPNIDYICGNDGDRTLGSAVEATGSSSGGSVGSETPDSTGEADAGTDSGDAFESETEPDASASGATFGSTLNAEYVDIIGDPPYRVGIAVSAVSFEPAPGYPDRQTVAFTVRLRNNSDKSMSELTVRRVLDELEVRVAQEFVSGGECDQEADDGQCTDDPSFDVGGASGVQISELASGSEIDVPATAGESQPYSSAVSASDLSFVYQDDEVEPAS